MSKTVKKAFFAIVCLLISTNLSFAKPPLAEFIKSFPPGTSNPFLEIAKLVSRTPDLTTAQQWQELNKANGKSFEHSVRMLNNYYQLYWADNFEILTITIPPYGSKEKIPELAKLVAQNFSLKSLRLHGDNADGEQEGALGPNQLAAFVSGFTQEPQSYLETLSLDNDNLGDEGVKALVPLFPNVPALRELNLSRNNISDEGLKMLAKAQLSSLQGLNLAGNQISNASIEVLVTLLQQASNLNHLLLLRNNIDDEGVKALVAALLKAPRFLRHIFIQLDLSEIGRKVIAEAKERQPNIHIGPY